jgi:hypothetical protein
MFTFNFNGFTTIALTVCFDYDTVTYELSHRGLAIEPYFHIINK